MPLSPRVAAYDHLLLDLDGCLWVGEAAVDGAPAALQAVREAGKGVAFLTNDPRHPPEEHVRKLWRLGFRAALSEVVTVGAAVQHLLATTPHGAHTAFVVGSEALVRHVADGGLRIANGTDLASRADLVVVGGHDGFDYAELRTAAQAVGRGARLVGTSRDAAFPMAGGPWPGSGAVLAAVETAAERTADVIVGKPEHTMYAAALERLGPGRVLAIGDRLDTDVLGARRAGLDAAVVLTGGTTAEAAATAATPPTHVADSFATLVLA